MIVIDVILMEKSKLFKNTIFYSIGEILPRAIAFLMLPIYTRYLSPEDYGINSYTHTIIMFLFVLGTFALNTYVLRYYFIHEEAEERRTLLGTIHLTIIGLNVLILGLAFLLMPPIIDFYKIQVPWNPYFRLAFIINFFECFSIIPLVLYRVRQDAIKFVALGLTRTVLTVLLTLFFVVYQKRGLLGSFEAQIYVLVPYSIVYFAVMQRYARWHIRWEYLKEGLRFSSPLLPGVICYQMLSVSDRIILERNVGIGELGIYNVACQMAFVLNIIIQSGYRAIEPELFRRYGKDDFYDFMRKTQSFFFFVIYVSAFALCLYSQEVFFVMTTEAFHGGYLLVPALIIGVIMVGQNVIYGGVLQGEKRTKIIGAATVVGAVISVVINLLLIPLWGTYAAATASAVSFFVMNTILFCSMTYPGKTMYRETILVCLIPGISYPLFLLLGDVCLVGVILKFVAVCIYLLIAKILMHVNVLQLRLFFVKRN